MQRERPLVVRVLPELDLGGVESRLRVQATTRALYDLQIVTLHKAGIVAYHIEKEGTRVHSLQSPPGLRELKTTYRLGRYLRWLRPDLIHASIVEANWHSAFADQLIRAPLILEEVGLPTQSLKQRLGLAPMYRLADRIVGVSQATCAHLIHQNFCPARRVKKIYTCAHPRFFPEARATPAGAQKGARFVLFTAGRLHPVKNHLGLLEAMAGLVHDRGLEVELRIAGSGPEEARLREKIAALELSEHVSLLGGLSDVRPALLEADLFVLPSFVEGCSNALIEALSSGLFAAVSDIPGNREVMGGLFDDASFPLHDTGAMAARLARLIHMAPAERQALAAAGQERAYAEFSAQAYQDRLVELYRELLPRRL